MDLHYSQTLQQEHLRHFWFESPMDLHYSQTTLYRIHSWKGLNPLWIYTTLKRRT